MQFSHTHSKGFTLIETLISIVIVSIAVITATAALQSSLQTSVFVKNQITARYLASDAMEYILALRDAGAATPQGWMSELLPCVTTVNGSVTCSVDTVNLSLTPITSTPSPLYLCSVSDGNGGTVNVFTQNNTGSCTQTIFTRTVTITPIQLIPGYSNDVNQYNEAIVSVKVSWGSGPFSSAQSYTLAEDIYNWQPPS